MHGVTRVSDLVPARQPATVRGGDVHCPSCGRKVGLAGGSKIEWFCRHCKTNVALDLAEVAAATVVEKLATLRSAEGHAQAISRMGVAEQKLSALSRVAELIAAVCVVAAVATGATVPDGPPHRRGGHCRITRQL